MGRQFYFTGVMKLSSDGGESLAMCLCKTIEAVGYGEGFGF